MRTTDPSLAPVVDHGGLLLDRELALALGGIESVDLAADLAGAREQMRSVDVPAVTADRTYGALVRVTEEDVPGPDGDLRVRIYQPVPARAGRPALLLLHGGAFVGGDRGAEHSRSLRFAADVGCVVVSPEYRLAPEHAYPAAHDDCAAVLAWMSSDPAVLGIDPGRIALGGVSAGGALAAGLALRLAEDERSPRALLLLYPVLDDRLDSPSMRDLTATPVWDAGNSVHMWALYRGERVLDRYAAPGRAEDLQGLPPTYLALAQYDPLRDEGMEFAHRLAVAGVPVDLRLWAGTYHVFDQLVPDAAVSRRSLADQTAFLARALAG